MKKVSNVVNYIYQFMALNVCFFVSNLLFIFCVVTLRPAAYTVPIFLVSALPFGSALAALLKLLARFREEGELSSIFKSYFQIFKKVFKTTIKYTLFFEILALILYVDMLFISRYAFAAWLNPLFLGFIVFLFMLYGQAINDYSVYEIDHLKSFSGIKGLLYVTFNNWFLALINALVLATLILLMIVQPIIGAFFAPAIAVFFIGWSQGKFKKSKEKGDEAKKKS